MVIYFSGTGNSKFIANKIGKELNDKIIDSTKYIKINKKATFESKEPFIFVCPTYAWQIPKLFYKFIEESEFVGSNKAYFVLNCGSDIGNAENTAKILCDTKKFEFMGIKEIVMPENYIAMFPVPDEKESNNILKKSEPIIEKAIEDIKEGKKFDERTPSLLDKIKSGIVNDMFYKLFVKDTKFYVKDSCISCGKCEEICMVNNIKIIDGKPTWNGDCTHCMACICHCPVEAIEYGKKSIGKRRYICNELK